MSPIDLLHIASEYQTFLFGNMHIIYIKSASKKFAKGIDL